MEIVYLWVSDYKNIKNQGFNFSSKYDCDYDKDNNKLTVNEKPYIKDFFGKNISNVTAIIGENGAGKSTVVEVVLILTTFDGNNIGGSVFILLYEYEGELCYFTSLNLNNNIKFDTKLKIKLDSRRSNTKQKHQSDDKSPSPLSGKVIHYSNIFSRPKLFQLHQSFYTYFIDKSTSMHTFNNEITFFTQKNIEFITFISNVNNNDSLKNIFEKLGISMPRYISITGVNISKQIEKHPYLRGKENALYNFIIDKLEHYTNSYYNFYIKNNIKLTVLLKYIAFTFESMGPPIPEGLDLKKEFNLSPLDKNDGDYLIKFMNILEQNIDKLLDEIKYEKYKYYTIEQIASIKNYLTKIKENVFQKNKMIILVNTLKDIDNFFQKYQKYLKNDGTYFEMPFDIFSNSIDNLRGLTGYSIPWKSIDYFSNINGVEFSWKNEPNIDFHFSGGEEAMLNILARVFILMEDDNKNPAYELIVLDEADLGLHPEWQRKFLNIIIEVLNAYGKSSPHIILTTHSPFVVSDLPSDNVIFLEKKKEDGKEDTDDVPEGYCRVVQKKDSKTFASNIHTLFAQSFFLENTIGAFAYQKITEVVEILKSQDISTEQKEYAQQIINIIGEPIIKNQLQSQLDEKFNIDAKIQRLKDEIKRLEDSKNKK